MPTGNVTTTHVSGGLTFADVIPDRIHAKIGTAETGDANKIYKISNFNQAKNIFTKGELVDSLKQYFEEFDESLGQTPVPVLCIRPENDLTGSVETPVLNRTTGNHATASISGTPTGSRVVKLKFTKGGACGVAEYRKSVDGGLTYASPLVTPASGNPIALDVGVNITFVDYATPSESFQVGDEWTIVIHAPGASNLSRLTALEKLKYEYDSDFVEIPERRRADKMHRIVYRESLPFLNGELSASGFDYLKATIDAAINTEMKAIGKPEIADHKIILDPDKSFKNTRILKAQLIMYVTGRINGIQWTTSFSMI